MMNCKRLISSLVASLGVVTTVSGISAPSLVITEVMPSNKNVVFDGDGDASDWVEIYNAGNEPVALKGYTLTDDPANLGKWAFPDRKLNGGEFLLVFASGKDRTKGDNLHTNFKLGAKGEFLGIYKGGESIQTFAPSLPKLGQNESYGVVFKGGRADMNKSGALLEPTPGQPNAEAWALPQTADTKFSQDRGFYDTPFKVAITSATGDAQIRYTTDGSQPNQEGGTLYEGPIEITTTTTLRAAAFSDGMRSSDIDTHTYIFPKAVMRQPESPEGWPSTRPGYAGRGGGGFFGFGRRQGGRAVDMDYAMAAPSDVKATEEEVVEALTSLPSLSVVTELSHLLDSKEGIYANPSNRGRDWERPISVELIDPTGGEEGFHWNAGLRIRGGHSRSPYCKKHAFRIYFRDDYGDGKLNYPLFGSEGVEEFDDIDLRTAQNYSYHYSDSGSQNTMVREVFSRDTQRAFGQPYARSRYYHLYLNGLYWGLYQSQEHTEASYGSSYFGGDEDDYDTIKASRTGERATDGNEEGWRHLYEESGNIAAESDPGKRLERYYDLQGLDAAGNPDLKKIVYLDSENLIDYMLIIFYTGNFDAPISRFMGNRMTNNWFSIFQRDGRRGFQFFCHDSEHSLGSDGGARINRVGPFPAGSDYRGSNPQWIHQQLLAVDEYRQAFQKRAEWALLGENGPLTETAVLDRIDRRAATVGKAILAECARWGDAKDEPRDGLSYTKQDWTGAIERLKEVATVRSQLLPEQLRLSRRFKYGRLTGELVPAPLFNPVPIPVMRWRDGARTRGTFQLSQGKTVFYTTDGSDPKDQGGASKATPSTTSRKSLLPAGSVIRAFVPKTNALKQTWTKPDFDDSKWRAGIGGVGYDFRPDYKSLIGVDVRDEAAGKFPSVLTRSLFKWDGSPIEKLVLNLKFEDGFIAYLNGVRVASHNAPKIANNVASAWGQHMDGEAMRWKPFDLSAHTDLLVTGKDNVLAIQTMNDRVGSSDLLIYPELVAEREISGTEITLGKGVREVRARAFEMDRWGPMRVVPIVTGEAGAATLAAAGNVVISEIMYHPGEPTAEEAADVSEDHDDFEFVEVMNISDEDVSLVGASFSNGIDYIFPKNASLKAGERAVIVKNLGAFQKRYADSKAKVLGLYDGGLKNSGEKLTLSDADDNVIASVSFKDSTPWPQSADGLGFSLVLKVPESNPSLNQAGNWQASSSVGGSPGAGDEATAGGVVINEILTHTDLPNVDAIELYNPTDAEIDLSGWFLTDDTDTPDKYRIQSGTKIAANGYVVIKGDNDDVPTNNDSLPADRFAKSFSLSSHGEEIYLFAADASGQRTGYSHGFEFIASQNGVSFGRHINSEGKELFPPQLALTLGAENAGPAKPAVVISEIMYHPDDNDEEEGEFIEIWNWGSKAAQLFDPANPANTWRLSGVKFTFPEEQTLKPNEVALITRLDPDTFRRRYKIEASIKVFGPLDETAKLSNKGERLRLLRPDLPDVDLETQETTVPMLEVDSVRYNDRDPWPEAADGEGVSMERIPASEFSDDPESWKGSAQNGGTPGKVPAASATP